MKLEDGILEIALHSGGGPLVFNGHVHEALVRAFRDIGDDPDNHVVILTGTGGEFCAQITPDGFDFFTPTGYDKILREGTKILENLLDIQVPMIAAINGPVTVHSEYALLCDTPTILRKKIEERLVLDAIGCGADRLQDLFPQLARSSLRLRT
jgi:enoyl-CoA hydratase/carnithine racemase